MTKIEHTGATSFTIESSTNSVGVVIEGVTINDDDVSGIDTLGCGAITTTGAITVGIFCVFVCLLLLVL